MLQSRPFRSQYWLQGLPAAEACSCQRCSPRSECWLQVFPAVEDAVPALLVTREIREHVNVFHTMTDLFNAYIALTMLGWTGTPRQV